MSAEQAIVAAMRGGADTLSAIRGATGLKAAEISRTVKTLRYAGKILFGELRLAPSMQDDGNSAVAATSEGSPGHAAEEGRDVPASGEEPAGGGGDVAAHASPPSPPASALSAAVQAEALELGARRRQARVLGHTAVVSLPRLAIAEQVQSIAAEDPAGVIHAVVKTHPQLWRRAVLVGRALEITPAAALYRAIAGGLDLIEADIGIEAAA